MLVLEKKELAWRAHADVERNEFLLALLAVRHWHVSAESLAQPP